MIALLLALALPAHATDAATFRTALDSTAGWKEVKTKSEKGIGEIKIRTKKVAGIDCLEGVTEVTGASRATLLDVAADIPSATRWTSAKISFSEVLAEGPGWTDYAQYLDNPMPVADRYWVLRGRREVKDPVSTYHWEHIDPSAYPAFVEKVAKDYNGVMTETNVGSWAFTDINGGVEVRYRLCTAVGGSIPQWAGEFAATSTLPTNIADLVKEARRRQK